MDALRTHGPLSKVDISAFTNLSAATVNRLVKNLLVQGYVNYAGTKESTGGRRPVLVQVVKTAIVVGAVQVHQDNIIGVLVGFDGEIIERHEREISLETPAGGPQFLRGMIATLIERGEEIGAPLRAIGVSIAGVTHPSHPITGLDARYWPDLLATDITDGFDLPIIIENDANVLAIGELHMGVGREAKDFVTLVLDRGLGAGIIANGSIYRGARAAAGEVGYLLLDSRTLVTVAEGQGELEAVLEPTQVTEALRHTGFDSERLFTAAEIISHALDGDHRFSETANRLLDGLARGVAALASILDPDIIVLGEGLDDRADTIIPALEQRLRGRINYVPDIRPASLGSDGVLLGAAEMALRASNLGVKIAP